VILFALDPEIAAITEHRGQGGRTVFVRYGRLVLATGRDEVTLVEVASIPLLNSGAPAFQIENVLAAVGAAWALGLSHELIRTGIETFKAD
jgi:cyanophycin synthetase